MRLLYYPARTVEQAEELEPGIGVSLHLAILDQPLMSLKIRVIQVSPRGRRDTPMSRFDVVDFECFTILRQTAVTGLQVQNRKGDCEFL